MKSHPTTRTLLGLFVTSALAVVPLASVASTPAASSPPAASAAADAAAKTLTGKVEAVSDTALTVGGHTLKLTAATTFSKAGAPAGRDDLKVGDTVSVTTSDDGETALAVDIAAAN